MFAVLSTIRKASALLLSGLLASLLAACQGPALPDSGSGGTRTSATVPVALLLPHGASNPQEQKLARDLENAARLASADLDGVRIDLRVYGTAGNAAQAQNAAENAVADGARIILGPLHAESANAVSVAVADKNVNVLAFSNDPTIAGGQSLHPRPDLPQHGRTACRLRRAPRQDRIMAVHGDNLAGRLGRGPSNRTRHPTRGTSRRRGDLPGFAAGRGLGRAAHQATARARARTPSS